MPHFMIVLIPYINLLNLSLIKMTIFEEYGAFKNIILKELSKLITDELNLLLFFRVNKPYSFM